MKFSILASGSKGNASLIYTDNTLIQIDMGVTLKMVDAELKRLGKHRSDIQGVFITHEHSDHISGLPLYHGKIPVYTSEGTLPKAMHLIHPFVPLTIGDFNIVPFSVSHDAANPVGYLIEDEHSRLAWVTDTGCLSEEVIELLKDCDYYYFESNHDLKMLQRSHRPASLKARVRSDHGHLNNIDSAIYMADLIGPHTKQIVLAHLSEECNTPDLALSSYEETLARHEVDIANIEIIPAARWALTLGGEK